MIVDDHGAFRQVIKAQLEPAGIECVECEDGQVALTEYAQARPDLVLMDIAMKVIDGLRATAQIKARYPAARIIMLTEYDDDDLREAARRAGAEGYWLKEDLSPLRTLLRSPAAPRPRPS